MNRIVNQGMKTDLHIHSSFSIHKDKDKLYLRENNIENISILIDKLNKNEVNICAISDHDVFSYDLYKRLKQEEGKGTIKKVLPAVEFSVSMKRNNKTKQIHIVTVFDDSDESKIKDIEKILEFKNGKPNYDEHLSFSEQSFLNILNDIGLNTVCIAHQKNTLTSTNIRKNDVNSLGEDAFNEFVFSEYFEAYEFKNKRNELFHNISKTKLDDDLLRFITGSDCHEWTVYPKYNASEEEGLFNFTYLKCLPTFKGLALALTDDTRISLYDNFFNERNKVLENFSLVIGDETKNIPLSRGINVIIGDNSIGKSLLLHKITNYYRSDVKSKLSPLTNKVIKGYDSYLKQNNIKVLTTVDHTDIFEFDTQGEIRKKFNLKMLKEEDFFKDKYPQDINVVEIKNILTNKVDEFITTLNNRFEYDKNVLEIPSIEILDIDVNASSLTFTKMSNETVKKEESKNNVIVKEFDKAIISLKNLSEKLELETDIKAVLLLIENLEKLQKKYLTQQLVNSKNLNIINCLNIALDENEQFYKQAKSSDDRKIEEYSNSKTVLLNNLMKVLKSSVKQQIFNFEMDEYLISAKTSNYLEYGFVKKTKVSEINSDYFKELLMRPINKTYKTDFEIITKKILSERLNQFEGNNPIEFYREKLKECIDDDLSSVESIVVDRGDKKEEYSDGLNVRIYFNILSTMKNKKGIYIIDQPEDDVSPNAIKEFILGDFKRMSRERQLIIVTHNPQFVVNLDADNIIHIGKENNEIKVKNGALEFENKDYKILDIVANSLEGGVETIRKRWKRYEKDISSEVQW